MSIKQETIDEVARVDARIEVESKYRYITKLKIGDIFHIKEIPCRYLGDEEYGANTDISEIKNTCTPGNCPFAPYSENVGWSISPEGLAEAKRNHEENHKNNK